MNERRPAQPVYAGVGTSSIILVFLVLCLTSFGVLALISARSSEQTMLKNTSEVCAYYEAVAEANEYIAECKIQGASGHYETDFDIDGRLELGVSFTLTEDGTVQIERFCTFDSTEDTEIIDFE